MVHIKWAALVKHLSQWKSNFIGKMEFHLNWTWCPNGGKKEWKAGNEKKIVKKLCSPPRKRCRWKKKPDRRKGNHTIIDRLMKRWEDGSSNIKSSMKIDVNTIVNNVLQTVFIKRFSMSVTIHDRWKLILWRDLSSLAHTHWRW